MAISGKKWAGIALSAAVALSLAACGNSSGSSTNSSSSSTGSSSGTDGGAAKPAAASGGEQQQQKLQKVRLGYLSVMDDSETILAYKADLYKKHGLDVDMKVFNSGTDLIKAIVGGQLDGGVLGFTNALSWIAKGSDLKIVGGAQVGFHSMLVRSDSGISDVSGLKGKSIASQQQGSTADIVLNGVVLKNAKLAKQDVNMQYVSPAVAIQSLAAGKVDGAFVFEPYSSIAQLSYPVKQIYEIGQQWPFPCMVVIASGDAVKNHRDIVNSMLDAQKEAIDMLQKDPAKAAGFITKEFIQEDNVKKADGTTVPAQQVIEAAIKSQKFNWAISDQDISRMQEVSQMMVDQGMMESKLDVSKALDLTWQQQQK